MHQQIAASVLAATAPEHEVSAAGAPTNQEIVDHAKAAYAQHSEVVDASVVALTTIIRSGSLTAQITAMDSAAWSGGKVPETVADPLFDSPEIRSVISAAPGTVKSYSVGVFSDQLPGGLVGVPGFARSVPEGTSSATTLSIDIFKHLVTTEPGKNLQLGQWLSSPQALDAPLYGLYLKTTVEGIAVALKILLDQTLKPFGFVESTGATLQIPLQASPFSGSIATS